MTPLRAMSLLTVLLSLTALMRPLSAHTILVVLSAIAQGSWAPVSMSVEMAGM